MSTSPQRYFVGTDSSSHRYLVPVERRQAWDKWCGIDESDERSWKVPAFAKPLSFAPHCLTFTDPQEPTK